MASLPTDSASGSLSRSLTAPETLMGVALPAVGEGDVDYFDIASAKGARSEGARSSASSTDLLLEKKGAGTCKGGPKCRHCNQKG